MKQVLYLVETVARMQEGEHLTRMRLFGNVHEESVVLQFGICPLALDTSTDVLIWDRKGHNGSRAISKIMKWMPNVLCS